MASDPFAVLIVCTGNICRSPIAEQVLRARFPSDAVQFSSAGTDAIDGDEMPEEAAEISRRYGGLPEQHRARLLQPELIEHADLVVAMTRDHRRDVVRLVPRANRFTFTVRELARLLESAAADPAVAAAQPDLDLDLPDLLRQLVPTVAAQRGFAEAPTAPEDDDVIDPYGRSAPTYDLSGEQITDAIDRGEAAMTVIVSRYGL